MKYRKTLKEIAIQYGICGNKLAGIRWTYLQITALRLLRNYGKNWYFAQDDRKVALRLEKMGLIHRTDENGNHFELGKKEEKEKVKLFVYGTLMRGFGNNRVIESGKFLQEDMVKGYKMYSLGAYPFVDKTGNDNVVKGEVFEVDQDTFRNADRLEGYPNFYNREKVTTKNGHEAYIYFINVEEGNHYSERPEVEDGDWREYVSQGRDRY